MKPATLLLLTFFIWIAAKGRLGQYWALANSSASSLPTNDSAEPGSGLGDANALPGSSNKLNPLPNLPDL